MGFLAYMAGLKLLRSHQIYCYVGDVARWWVTTSPVTSGLAAGFRAASMKCFQFDSRIQISVILGDVHVELSSGKYWLVFFYLWTYKQRESSCLPVGETYQDTLERNTQRENSDISESPWTAWCFLKGQRMKSETMALGHGSKRSTSCDQEVAPSPLNSEVSNCTSPLLETFRSTRTKGKMRIQRILLAFYSLFGLKRLFWL